MSRSLSTDLLNEFYGQESADPFLMLITLYQSSFGYLRFVNNSEEIVSNGMTFLPFPMKLTFPTDDGKTAREVEIEFDNVSLELIEEIRGSTKLIDAKVEMVLASNPDNVEIEMGELKIKHITYNQFTIRAKLRMDDFLNTELSSEKYTPTNFPGIFS